MLKARGTSSFFNYYIYIYIYKKEKFLRKIIHQKGVYPTTPKDPIDNL